MVGAQGGIGGKLTCEQAFHGTRNVLLYCCTCCTSTFISLSPSAYLQRVGPGTTPGVVLSFTAFPFFQIRFADRLISDSCTRIIERRTLDELRHDLVRAVEAVAVAVEEDSGAETTSAAAADLLVPPQNVMCPHFPEFW